MGVKEWLIGYSWQNEPKILQAQARSCIRDSLSRTTCTIKLSDIMK